MTHNLINCRLQISHDCEKLAHLNGSVIYLFYVNCSSQLQILLKPVLPLFFSIEISLSVNIKGIHIKIVVNNVNQTIRMYNLFVKTVTSGFDSCLRHTVWYSCCQTNATQVISNEVLG